MILFELGEYSSHFLFRKGLKRVGPHIAKGIEMQKNGHSCLSIGSLQNYYSVIKAVCPINIFDDNVVSFYSPVDNVVKVFTHSFGKVIEHLSTFCCLAYMPYALIGKRDKTDKRGHEHLFRILEISIVVNTEISPIDANVIC